MPAQALIVAADVFCYFGQLDEVLALCRERLSPGGLLLFSVERMRRTSRSARGGGSVIRVAMPMRPAIWRIASQRPA